jgi:hypothetical protein
VDSISNILGISAGVTQLVGYYVYVRVTNGHANTGSWLIWTLSAGVDLVSYDFVTGGDVYKNILPAACALACVVTFLILLFRGKFQKPDSTDWNIVGADSAISFVWWQAWVSGILANLMLQATTVASAIPMIRGMLSGQEQEDTRPWAIWTAAYVCHFVAVSMQLDHWSELAYPAANVFMHAAVLCVAHKTSSLTVAKR